MATAHNTHMHIHTQKAGAYMYDRHPQTSPWTHPTIAPNEAAPEERQEGGDLQVEGRLEAPSRRVHLGARFMDDLLARAHDKCRTCSDTCELQSGQYKKRAGRRRTQIRPSAGARGTNQRKVFPRMDSDKTSDPVGMARKNESRYGTLGPPCSKKRMGKQTRSSRTHRDVQVFASSKLLREPPPPPCSGLLCRAFPQPGAQVVRNRRCPKETKEKHVHNHCALFMTGSGFGEGAL